MQAFTDFILQVTYPPNPIRNLDNSLTADQQAGRDFFMNTPSDFVQGPCGTCHTLDPEGNPGVAAEGFFGSSGEYTFRFETQVFKVAHFRNAYQKVGMFGMAALEIFPGFPLTVPGDHDHKGDQVRGFGFLHDGSFDTVFRFTRIGGFTGPFPGNIDGFADGPEGDPQRRQVEAFILAFDTNLAPIAGQQVTLTESNPGAVGERIDLLISRAEAGECDLVAKSRFANHELGFFYVGAGHFMGDREALPAISDAVLRQYAALGGRPVTYTCAPPGSGERIGVDRDSDGYLDGDERDAGSDPADPSSTP
jgi:hypothetical protein